MPDNIDTIITDAVAAVTTQPDPPDYIRPAELSALAGGLALQTIGLRIGRMFATPNTRGKGYHIPTLLAGYRAHLARGREQRERLALDQLAQETEAAEMQARLERIRAERIGLEQEERRLQREIKGGNQELAKELAKEEQELQRQQAETRRLNQERERQRQAARRMERPIPTGAPPQKRRPRR